MTDPDPLAVLTRETYDSPALDDAQRDLARSLTQVVPIRRTRRRRIAISVAVAALTVPGVAAAAHLAGVNTGWFGDPTRNTEDVDTSEWLNTCSPEYAEVVRQHQPDSALPPGFSWERQSRWMIEEAATNADCAADGTGVLMQEVGIDSSYAFFAQCAWLSEARTAGADEVRRARAGRELKTLANSDLNHAIDGGGIVRTDNRLADAVLAGRMDDRLLQDFFASSCRDVVQR